MTLLTVRTVKNSKFQKFKMVAAAILKNRKIEKSPYLGCGSTDFDEISLLTIPTVKNLKFRKSKMEAAVIFRNRKIAISHCGLSDCDKIRHDDAARPSGEYRPLKNSKFQKSKMASAAILKNRKIAASQPRFDRFEQNLTYWPFGSLKM